MAFFPKRTLLAAILLFSALPIFAQGTEPVLPDPGNTGMSREQQIQVGLKATSEIYKQMPVLPDSSPETQYVRRLGERLVAQIPREYSWPFDFHVIAQREINAFALPGGEMFVNIGTIAAANNEAQLAGVMAHEMSHVYMQHSAKQMQKQKLTQGLAGLAGAILGRNGGFMGDLANVGVQAGAGIFLLRYSRQDEAQADAVGAIIMYRAGYNPQALADFFQIIDQQGGGSGPQFLSDHPNPGNREEAIQREVQQWPPRQYQSTSAEFARIRQSAAGVKAYSAQEISSGAKTGQWESLNRSNGAVFRAPAGIDPSVAASATSNTVDLKDVLPSSRMVPADLGSIRIDRPENWQVIAPQQRGDSITIAPRAGVVSNGVGYGVVINQYPAGNGRTNIDQQTADIVQQLTKGDSGLQQVGGATRIKVAGTRGRSVNLQSTSPFTDANGQSLPERDWLVTVPRKDKSVTFLVFVAPQRDFERLLPTFQAMLKELRLQN